MHGLRGGVFLPQERLGYMHTMPPGKFQYGDRPGPVPCPKGTFGQEAGARSVERCDKCPRFRFSTQDVVNDDIGFALGGREIQDCFYEHLRAARVGPLGVLLVTLTLLIAALVV